MPFFSEPCVIHKWILPKNEEVIAYNPRVIFIFKIYFNYFEIMYLSVSLNIEYVPMGPSVFLE